MKQQVSKQWNGIHMKNLERASPLSIGVWTWFDSSSKIGLGDSPFGLKFKIVLVIKCILVNILNFSSIVNQKGEQDSQIWMADIWHFLGFSDFFLWFPPWNNESKSCPNDIKFWEFSGNPKTSRFWKLQLFMSSGTQKVSNVRHPYQNHYDRLVKII